MQFRSTALLCPLLAFGALRTTFAVALSHSLHAEDAVASANPIRQTNARLAEDARRGVAPSVAKRSGLIQGHTTLEQVVGESQATHRSYVLGEATHESLLTFERSCRAYRVGQADDQ